MDEQGFVLEICTLILHNFALVFKVYYYLELKAFIIFDTLSLFSFLLVICLRNYERSKYEIYQSLLIFFILPLLQSLLILIQVFRFRVWNGGICPIWFPKSFLIQLK